MCKVLSPFVVNELGAHFSDVSPHQKTVLGHDPYQPRQYLGKPLGYRTQQAAAQTNALGAESRRGWPSNRWPQFEDELVSSAQCACASASSSPEVVVGHLKGRPVASSRTSLFMKAEGRPVRSGGQVRTPVRRSDWSRSDSIHRCGPPPVRRSTSVTPTPSTVQKCHCSLEVHRPPPCGMGLCHAARRTGQLKATTLRQCKHIAPCLWINKLAAQSEKTHTVALSVGDLSLCGPSRQDDPGSAGTAAWRVRPTHPRRHQPTHQCAPGAATTR